MLFDDILDIHNSFQPPGSHGDILGDGYLLDSNPLYRSVKTVAVKIGCRFVEASSEYLLLPFNELPNILARREVPYVPSARLMKKVERGRPGTFAVEDLPMPESYHLHEAAHVIAEHFLKDIEPQNQQEQILKAILAESFANTVDALVCVHASDEIHDFFIKQNCYMHPQKKIALAMNGLIESMGFQFTFMLTFFSYVHANFLAKPMTNQFVLELASSYAPGKKLTANTKKDVGVVLGIGEKLDPLFRINTTSNYFKQQGFDEDLQELLAFSFMKVFAGNHRFKEATEAFGQALT